MSLFSGVLSCVGSWGGAPCSQLCCLHNASPRAVLGWVFLQTPLCVGRVGAGPPRALGAALTPRPRGAGRGHPGAMGWRRSLDVFHDDVAPDKGVEKAGGQATQEQHPAHDAGRVVQLALAQGPAADDLQRALLLGRRGHLDGVRDRPHGAVWGGRAKSWVTVGLLRAPGCL